jgi:adenosylcobyric acid synthase
MQHPHGGNLRYLSQVSGLDRDRITDFSANINPLGLPDWLRPTISSCLSSIVHYPDPDCTKLISAAAVRYGCGPDEIAVGNGSSELLHLIPRVAAKKRAVIPVPSYSDYEKAASQAGLEIVTVEGKEQDSFAVDLDRLDSIIADDLVILCNPNNPTGGLIPSTKIRLLAEKHSEAFFLIDEAFMDFVQDTDRLVSNRPKNVIVLLSLTKIFAVPGLRLGLAIGESLIITGIKRIQPTWSVNTFAQEVGAAALQDRDYIDKTRRFVSEERNWLTEQVRGLSAFMVYPSAANFLFCKITCHNLDAHGLATKLLKRGIAIRVCGNFRGLDSSFFRIAVKSREDNENLIASMRSVLGGPALKPKAQKTPALMFQGTSSNAGKSVLTAAMCRILLQDGFRPAPFKSQNMSLNSFVTRDGGEMGRAQVVQAQACKLDPNVRMNPILLKPNTDTGSQVIVMGKPVGNMEVMDYTAYKPVAFEAVKSAYDSLAEEFQVIVLEGAGSPGEVNLKSHDIVNMQMAKYAAAPVLLVGDIDRGGVFASFVGTMEVLAEWERSLVAGFVVNRFRGKAELLTDAFDYVNRHTGRSVLGVIPYLQNLGLPDEDSVTFKALKPSTTDRSDEHVEIAVIDLPHISNFTDFDPFLLEPDVRLKIVRKAEDLGTPDAIVIPGTKNTMGDLAYLRQTGLDQALLRAVETAGAELIGVCGGFQMIGAEIRDPNGLETNLGSAPGLGFLPVVTVLEADKTLSRFHGTHVESGLPVWGYEIHHGQTAGAGLRSLFEQNGLRGGAVTENGKVWGTYIHGVFDSDEFRRWFIDRLRVGRGLPAKGKVLAVYDIEAALDRLADVVRRGLDIPKLYDLMGLK